MKYELFIAQKLFRSGSLNSKGTKPIIQLIIAGIAVGFAVMLITLAVVTGYNKAIRDKLSGFEGHIQISKFDDNNSYETQPILKNENYVTQIKKMPGVAHIQEFATKACIAKTKTEFEGIIAKGIGSDFDWSYFKSCIIKGNSFNIIDKIKSDEVLISNNLATKMKLNVGDKLTAYFIQNPPRARVFNVAGIYVTGLEEFDNLFMFCDIAHLRKLNDWDSTLTGGYEIRLKDFNTLDKISDQVYQIIPSTLNSKSITEKYPQIFDWLNLTDKNGIVIIVLMLIVVIINMISALIILILEKVNFIGTMKALGTTSGSMQKIFLWIAAMLIARGLLIGNVVGLALCLLQQHFGIITLDQSNYYISQAPINFNWEIIIALNIGVFLLCLLTMLIPVKMIERITAVKILRYR